MLDLALADSLGDRSDHAFPDVLTQPPAHLCHRHSFEAMCPRYEGSPPEVGGSTTDWWSRETLSRDWLVRIVGADGGLGLKL